MDNFLIKKFKDDKFFDCWLIYAYGCKWSYVQLWYYIIDNKEVLSNDFIEKIILNFTEKMNYTFSKNKLEPNKKITDFLKKYFNVYANKFYKVFDVRALDICVTNHCKSLAKKELYDVMNNELLCYLMEYVKTKYTTYKLNSDVICSFSSEMIRVIDKTRFIIDYEFTKFEFEKFDFDWTLHVIRENIYSLTNESYLLMIKVLEDYEFKLITINDVLNCLTPDKIVEYEPLSQRIIHNIIGVTKISHFVKEWILSNSDKFKDKDLFCDMIISIIDKCKFDYENCKKKPDICSCNIDEYGYDISKIKLGIKVGDEFIKYFNEKYYNETIKPYYENLYLNRCKYSYDLTLTMCDFKIESEIYRLIKSYKKCYFKLLQEYKKYVESGMLISKKDMTIYNGYIEYYKKIINFDDKTLLKREIEIKGGINKIFEECKKYKNIYGYLLDTFDISKLKS
jgi:hypothetical protein